MTKKIDGQEVRNAARSLRIDITEADIKKGKVLDPEGCAAAQAMLRSTKASAVMVHRGVTYLKIGKNWQRYRTSASLRMETIVFDRGGTFMPGEYDLLPVPLDDIVKTKRSPSKGMTGRQSNRATRRLTIPGVRRTARSTEKE